MDMTGERRILAARQVVWGALNDPDVLRATIPGCESLEKQSDTAMKATAAVKIGPISARFTGNVQLSDMDPPNGYTISGEGQGGVAGFAKGGAKVKLEEENGATVLRYEVHAQVGGKLAQLGARLVDATAKQLAEQFFDRFSARVAPAAAPAEAVAATVAPAPVAQARVAPASVAAAPVAAAPAALAPVASAPVASAPVASALVASAHAPAPLARVAPAPAPAAHAPLASAAPVAPARAREPARPTGSPQLYPAAPSSEVAEPVLPPPYPQSSISIFDLIPPEPFGLPIAAWIGCLVYLFIVLLFIGTIF